MENQETIDKINALISDKTLDDCKMIFLELAKRINDKTPENKITFSIARLFYTPIEGEIFKKIENSNYSISNMGRVINCQGKLMCVKNSKSHGGLYSTKTVSIVINGKVARRSVPSLMMETFKPNDRVPVLKRGNTFKKSGRPSKESVKKATYNIKYSKKVEFIDGDSNNLKLDNLRYMAKIKNSKYRNVFYNGDVLIKQIEKNTTQKNKEDNETLIKFLKGDDAVIWKLFNNYKNLHKALLNKKIKEHKIKEIDMTVDDFITDVQIKMINKIKEGRFDGVNFQGWSTKTLISYYKEYFIKNKKLAFNKINEKFT